MRPFQVNCSELIADFNIHDDKEVRNILAFLVKEYDVELYFEIKVSWEKEFFFNENSCFNIESDDIPFNVSINNAQHYEYWIAKSKDKVYLEMIIESIEKCQIQRYDESEFVASSSLARNLINRIITLTPGYSQSKDLIGVINFDEVFELNIKIGSGTYVTTLCYGSNGYDDELGWYFNAEHYDQYTYPFYEWAERNYNAKIKPFDGGRLDGYFDYKENPEKERLGKKL
ncbi:hypothetical protein [Pseudobacteroides cellulosolvens]|uniref:Uncharacterized protein n=1 Tax=Pseudobacteroides cellulosolvens ATCC 35603 = DSM 2933 TaxID=398512 RepID=A0A0L6JMD2_9FIRM|nr:hypothetical protein [Pseudobacteroides cellulosolvens]KNY26915.1 hypothetical protein Bccel_2180 [Pseudobacteroides cellulosolvens ATCC 35603 = DSM 2933]